MITDSRIGRDADGRPATPDPALTGKGWTRGLNIPDMAYAVRVDPRPGSASMPIDASSVVPLPHFVGLAGFVRSLPALLLRLWRTVGRTDVVVTRLPGLIGTSVVLLAKIRSKQIALEVVGDPQDALDGDKLSHRVMAHAGTWLTRWGVRQAHAVRYVTQAVLQQKYPPHPKATAVAFSSVRLDRWLRIPKGPESPFPSVIAVGSQQQMYKGHDLLIRAMPAVHEVFPEARLILVGDGQYQRTLRELATAEGVAHAVDFAGHMVDVTELIQLVDSAWVFALPSRAEGLPRALIEGMARGKPCIGTKVGGIVELLDEVQLVEPENVRAIAGRVIEFFADSGLRFTLAARNASALAPYLPQTLEDRAAEWTRAVELLSQN